MLDQVMIDIETLGTKPDAAIVSIGAIAFDLAGYGVDLNESLYEKIELASAMRYGSVDPDTLAWWLKQPDDARHEITNPNRTLLGPALAKLLAFIEEHTTPRTSIWANPPQFDLVILNSALDATGYAGHRWNHRAARCYRTVAQTIGFDIPRPETRIKHHALFDAVAQAQHLQQIFASLHDQSARPVL